MHNDLLHQAMKLAVHMLNLGHVDAHIVITVRPQEWLSLLHVIDERTGVVSRGMKDANDAIPDCVTFNNGGVSLHFAKQGGESGPHNVHLIPAPEAKA